MDITSFNCTLFPKERLPSSIPLLFAYSGLFCQRSFWFLAFLQILLAKEKDPANPNPVQWRRHYHWGHVSYACCSCRSTPTNYPMRHYRWTRLLTHITRACYLSSQRYLFRACLLWHYHTDIPRCYWPYISYCSWRNLAWASWWSCLLFDFELRYCQIDTFLRRSSLSLLLQLVRFWLENTIHWIVSVIFFTCFVLFISYWN